jgi:hypothetical protein
MPTKTSAPNVLPKDDPLSIEYHVGAVTGFAGVKQSKWPRVPGVLVRRGEPCLLQPGLYK